MIIKSSLGLSFGVVFSVLLFKRRAWPAWVGLGFGAGRAWEESDGMFTLRIIYDFGSSVALQAAL
jgi:inner membrane organizing system protein 1